jgi:hypothetical protein
MVTTPFHENADIHGVSKYSQEATGVGKIICKRFRAAMYLQAKPYRVSTWSGFAWGLVALKR